ncbi:MAG: hypothetical protein KDH96_09340 [Candidatus Riesia sp.]|nr:hypothetical protein [Candidatus Riesia sp.]
MQYIPKVRNIEKIVHKKDIDVFSGEYFFVIDGRETRILEAIRMISENNAYNIKYFSSQLTYGDIHVYKMTDSGTPICLMIIERKKYDDFLSSISDKRIENIKTMANYCAANNITPILVIENVNKLFRRAPRWDKDTLKCTTYVNGVNAMAIRMMLNSLMLKHGVKIIMSCSQLDTIMQISKIITNKYFDGGNYIKQNLFHSHKPLEEIELLSVQNNSGSWNVSQLKSGGRYKQKTTIIDNIHNYMFINYNNAYTISDYVFNKEVQTTTHDFILENGIYRIIFHNNTFRTVMVNIINQFMFFNSKIFFINPIDITNNNALYNVKTFAGNNNPLVFITKKKIRMWAVLTESFNNVIMPDINIVFSDILFQQSKDNKIFLTDDVKYNSVGLPRYDFNNERVDISPMSVINYILAAMPIFLHVKEDLKDFLLETTYHELDCIINISLLLPDIVTHLSLALNFLFYKINNHIYNNSIYSIDIKKYIKILNNFCICKQKYGS